MTKQKKLKEERPINEDGTEGHNIRVPTFTPVKKETERQRQEKVRTQY